MDLLDLQRGLKEGIEDLFPGRLWVRAEISSLKARPGGHCYMELSQSGPEGLLAKLRAVCWANVWSVLSLGFEQATGSRLAEGMDALLEVQLSYSELYGLSLVVYDLDPDFSLGEQERKRRETLARLEAEGLMDLQKSLSLPRLPRRIAVVSASDAAGYRDFVRHVMENEYGFAMCLDLFPALMQGATAPDSMVEALDAVLESGTEYDAVVIMRGGGARLDLACFDDYLLASHIAQYPLPVLTAVGHDQDFHVCDMVAYEYLKTPTALADWLVDIYRQEDEYISGFVARLRLAFAGKISAMESRVGLLEARILAADPRNVLRRGYVLAVGGDGRVLKQAAGARPGERVSVMFHDGTVECKVEKVNKN